MKVLSITSKNLKLLMRSRTSMFVIIFAPLLIMLLVGFAFNNPSASKLNIGYYSKDKTNLTLSFISALQSNSNFVLSEYNDAETCKQMIEQGKIHICIVFPEDFRLENNKTNEIIFYVDQSRANFVYAIIDTVSKKVNLQSSQLSYQLTNDLLSVISMTQKANVDIITKVITLKSSLSDMTLALDDIQNKLNNLDLTRVSVNTDDMVAWTGNIQTDVKNIQSKGHDVINSGNTLVSNLQGHVDVNASGQLTDFSDTLVTGQTNIDNATTQATDDITLLVDVIDTASADILKLNMKLDNARTVTNTSDAKMQEVQASLTAMKNDLDGMKSSLEKVNSQISALTVTSAENIVNPIKTTVTPITTKATNLNFIFPYLIVLIIAFISIMLSSTIIIMEKTSKAYFRNFTTPTKDFTFIISVFLTTLFVVIAQLVLILILAYYFLNTTILTNVWLTLLVILCAITLFTLIGMIIGYMFNSQEAVTMASISVGSVFLFLSNLVLPLESMSDIVQKIARFNPYVVASELLKKITLFSATWAQVNTDFLLMALYIVVAFVIALIIERMSKIQYISKRPMIKQMAKNDIIDKYFKLKSGILLRDEKELLQELKKMSDITFQDYVTDKKNDFESWLLLNKQNELAKLIGKARTRKEMIQLLEGYKNEIVDPLKQK